MTATLPRSQRLGFAVAAPVIALVAALVVTSIAMLAGGHDPVAAFRAMLSYASSAESLVAIVNRGVPYYLAGIAVAIGFRMGLFNIGVDGQYRLAAVVAAAAGAAVRLPAVLHVAFVMVVAIGVGTLWAAVPAALKVTRGVSEVISTIMMNFVATGLAAYLLQNHFKVPDDPISKTEALPASGRMGSLDWLLTGLGIDLPSGTHLHGFLIVAIVLGVAFHLVITRTLFGFELTATGINPFASSIGGVATRRMTVKTLLLSGAIAGLVGMAPLLNEFYRYAEAGFPTQLAFTGIAVALLGRNHPAGIAVAAFVFAFIERGAVALDNLAVPSEISRIMQGSLILAGVIGYEVVRRRSSAAKTAAVAALTTSSGSEQSVATSDDPAVTDETVQR